METHVRIVAVSDVYLLDNLPRLATLIREARAGVDQLIVAVPGDFLAPSVLSSLDNGLGMVACLNALGVTHVTFGNHEDDIPHDALVERMRELSARWLATNVRIPGQSLLDHDVLEVNGIRVGVFGVVLADPLMYRGAPFGGAITDPRQAALAQIDRMLGELGCSWVVALTHQAIDADRALARELHGRPVTILGAHEHTPLEENIDGIRILKAGSEATHAIIVDATWPAPGGPMQITGRLEPVAPYAEDPELRALVDRHLAPLRALSTVTLLQIAPGTVLSSVGVRRQQTTFGELVCSRMRDVLAADTCIFNAGGIRASREYRDRLTFGDVEAELPFDNEVVVVAMPGRVLAAAIESSRGREHGGYLQVDDHVRVDGDRVTTVANLPLDAERIYRVALIREICFGLDRNDVLMAFASAHPEQIPEVGAMRTPKELLVRSFALAIWKQLGGFAALDANGDGQIVPAEVAAALARADHDGSSLAAEIVIGALDSNRDGVVSKAEAGS